MTQKTVFIAGIIGLVFGFLFAGTLGIDFFGEDNSGYVDDGNNENNDGTALKKDEEAFRVAYNLDESIYMPITGDDAYDKVTNGDTFILYAGRDTCPYCQQFVPVLMEAAENQGVEMIYHVDTLDPLNEDFVDDEGVYVTPTTFIYKDGVLVSTIVGYKSLSDTEQLIEDALS